MFETQIIVTLSTAGLRLKKAGTNARKGPEYVGPCPWCGGHDRFSLHPAHAEAKEVGGLYYCRRCKAKGTGRQLLERLGLPLPDGMATSGRKQGDAKPRGMGGRERPVPPARWQTKGKGVVRVACELFHACLDEHHHLTDRGITMETASALQIGYTIRHEQHLKEEWGLSPDANRPFIHIFPGLLLPTFRGNALYQLSIRLNEPFMDSAHYKIPGSRPIPAIFGLRSWGKLPVVLVESWLDAAYLWQETRDLVIPVALDCAQAEPDPLLHRLLRESPEVLVALDDDQPGDAAASRLLHMYERSRRVKVPVGKDPTGYYQQGHGIRELLVEEWLKGKSGKTPTPQKVALCRSVEEAQRAVASLREARALVAIDVKTAPPRDDDHPCQDPRRRKPVLITLGNARDAFVTLEAARFTPQELSGLLHGLELVTHDAVEAMAVLRGAGIMVKNMDCTLLLGIACEGARTSFTDAAQLVGGGGHVPASDFAKSIEARHIKSSARDCRAIAKLWTFFSDKITATDTQAVYQRMKQAQPRFVDLRLNGMACSPSGDLADEFEPHRSPDTLRVHGRFEIASAVSGRSGCKNCNLQGVNKKDPAVRRRFRAPAGRVLVGGDVSQEEIRIMAILSRDQELCGMYERGDDVHARTAAMLLALSPEDFMQLPPEEQKKARKKAKVINFTLLYGGTSCTLQKKAAENGIYLTDVEAYEIRADWLRMYAGVATRQEQEKRNLQGPGALTVRTPSGRKVRLEPGDLQNWNKRLNIPVQAAGAEILLATLSCLDRHLAGVDAMLVNVIHDEILLEVAEQAAEAARQALVAAWTEGWLAVFPGSPTLNLVVTKVGPTWADMRE